MIKGITVELFQRAAIGVDAFNAPIYEETSVQVENVLIAPASSTETLDALNLTGKKAVYSLAIPKGDTHEWTGNRVRFFGQSWRCITIAEEGIEAMIPLCWNRKVLVERYE